MGRSLLSESKWDFVFPLIGLGNFTTQILFVIQFLKPFLASGARFLKNNLGFFLKICLGHVAHVLCLISEAFFDSAHIFLIFIFKCILILKAEHSQAMAPKGCYGPKGPMLETMGT